MSIEHIAQKNTQIASKYLTYFIYTNSLSLIYDNFWINIFSQFKIFIYLTFINISYDKDTLSSLNFIIFAKDFPIFFAIQKFIRIIIVTKIKPTNIADFNFK